MEEQSNQQAQAVVNEPKPPQMAAPKKKSGAGKKVLAVLLAILVLGGVAYGTYYFTKQQAEEDAAAVIVPLQAKVADLEAKLAEMEASDSKSAEGSYLEIEQWGVRLTPTDSAMSYVITGESDEFVHLSNEAVQGLGGCKSTAKLPELGSVAILSRYTEKQTNEGSSAEYITKIGDYYYYVTGSQAPCSTGEKDRDVESNERTKIIEAAKTVEASEE